MRNLVIVAVCLLGFCAISVAQDSQFEVFGGFNVLIPEEYVPVDSLYGWEGSFTVNANEYASAVIDISGLYYSAADQEIAPTSIHNFLVGPQIKIPKFGERFVPFVRALFGLGHVRFADDLVIPGEGEEDDIPLNDEGQLNDNGFTMAFGGGLDIPLNERMSIRPAQMEYMMHRLDGEFINSFRFAAGVIFNIGER
jgi:opacity protein-like surface antigen